MFWAIIYLTIALLAGLFAFGGFAAASAGAAQALFVVFLLLGLATAVAQTRNTTRK